MRKRQVPTATAAQSFVQTQLLTIPEVAKMLSVGRTKVYGLINRAGLPTVDLDGVKRVSVVSLQQWIKQREQAS